jgi:exopolysaccharide biosynthesis WecB/TagA/CpsF family protein
MIDQGKKNLLGVNVDAVDYDGALARILDAAKNREPLAVTATAVHGLMEGATDAEHRYRLNQLELVVPDGQPVRWALNLLHGAKLTDRVYGPNLMLKTLELAADNNLSVYLFGGSDELLATLKAKLHEQFPHLQIARARASRFRTVDQAEKQELIDDINASGASIVCVGLGCPRQEVWAFEFKDHIRMPVLAVGAAFNFHAGELDQAPPALQKYGLEWAYRLVKEPKRLWRRYLILNPYYIGLLLAQRLGLMKKRFDPASAVKPTTEILYG